MVDLQALRHVVDPYGHGIPRRAVIVPETGLVCDKTRAPTLPEIDCISQMCHLVFGTEPRDPAALVHRALLLDIPSAWTALRDDLLLGHTFSVPADLASHLVKIMENPPDGVRAFVCLKLAPHFARTERILSKLVDLNDPHVLSACRDLEFDVHTVAHMLMTRPETSVVFITHPRLLEIHRLQPTVCRVLCDYAMTLPAHQRYPPLSIVAQLVHSGVAAPQDHPVGLDTLRGLRRGRYDVKVAAAAAVLCQHHADPTVRSLSTVIETLSASIQRASTVPTRGPSN